MTTRVSASWAHSRQRGTVLVMAMVILLILTIIGVTAMNTSSLEAKMATNIQETNRAFEAAESGLNKAMNTSGSFDLFATGGIANEFSFGDLGRQSHSHVVTKWKSYSPPKRGAGYSAINYDSANFEQRATGCTQTSGSPPCTTSAGARSILNQGASQIINKSQ